MSLCGTALEAFTFNDAVFLLISKEKMSKVVRKKAWNFLSVNKSSVRGLQGG